MPVALNLAIIPSTSAVLRPAQIAYRKVVKPSGEQVKPPKLIPPATYNRDSTKASKILRVTHAESRDAGGFGGCHLDGHAQGFGATASGQRNNKNKPTKYRGIRDGNADWWMMLMKRHLEKAHAKATPLD